MTILYPTPAPVKSRKFAAGLVRSLPTYYVADHTVSDEAEYAEMLREEAAYNAHLEAAYLESRQIDRLCRGPIL